MKPSPMQSKEELPSWLALMPAIDLAGSVPLRGDFGDTAIVESVTDGGVMLSGFFARLTVVEIYRAGWRVDLDDPQGFGYALTVWGGQVRIPLINGGTVVDRWLRGITTCADRLAVAKALAAVLR